MKITKLAVAFLMLTGFYTFAAAQKAVSKTPAQIAVEDNVYRNSIHKFSIVKPEGWIETETEAVKANINVGKAIMQPNKKGSREIDESINRTQILFSLLKYPAGTLENASLACAIETSSTPNATAAQTALATQESFRQNYGYTLVSPAKPITLGGAAFYMIKMEKAINSEITLRQRIYIRKTSKGYLQFVMTAVNVEDEAVMEDALQSFKIIK